AVPAGDVAFEFADGELAFGNNHLHNVADGYHTSQPAIFHDRQVAQAFVRHQRHAILDDVVGADVQNIGGHQLGDGRGLGGAPFEDDLARVIAFGKHTRDLAVFDDH